METKLFEIRDEGTLIPILALKTDGSELNDAERWLWDRAGFGRDGTPYVLFATINGGDGKITCDPSDWGRNRTMREAHEYIEKHFDELEHGAVVDVEYVLGLRAEPKTSDRFHPLGLALR